MFGKTLQQSHLARARPAKFLRLKGTCLDSGLGQGPQPNGCRTIVCVHTYPYSVLISQGLSSRKASCSFMSLKSVSFFSLFNSILGRSSFGPGLGHLTVREGLCLGGWLGGGLAAWECFLSPTEACPWISVKLCLRVCFQALEKRSCSRVCRRIPCVSLSLRDLC